MAAVGAMVLLAGCGDITGPDVDKKTPRPEVEAERVGDMTDGGFFRYVDNETNAVCYIAQNGNNDPAIDCVKLNESDMP